MKTNVNERQQINYLGSAYSVKLVFSCVVKGIKVIFKITAKFCASRYLHFEDTERIMSPKMHLKSFRTFKKRAPGNKIMINVINDK